MEGQVTWHPDFLLLEKCSRNATQIKTGLELPLADHHLREEINIDPKGSRKLYSEKVCVDSLVPIIFYCGN